MYRKEKRILFSLSSSFYFVNKKMPLRAYPLDPSNKTRRFVFKECAKKSIKRTFALRDFLSYNARAGCVAQSVEQLTLNYSYRVPLTLKYPSIP
jgi:hypothetical protein